MAGKVVVIDINQLENYCKRLSELKKDIETNASKLASISDNLKEKSTSLNNATNNQSSNWKDPQYEKLKNEIAPCVTAVNNTSNSVNSMAATIKSQMEQVDVSIAYIRQLIGKLREI